VKAYLRNLILKKNLKRNDRHPGFIGYNEIKNVGVLFTCSTNNNFAIIEGFVRKLQDENKSVKAIGFVKSKNALPESKSPLIQLIGIKETNWLGFPSNDLVFDFYGKGFDLLIDLSNGNNTVIRYFVSLAKAKLIVGGKSKTSDGVYDLVIEQKENTALNNHISNICHYLNIIKSV